MALPSETTTEILDYQSGAQDCENYYFRFLDLPPEIRRDIYIGCITIDVGIEDWYLLTKVFVKWSAEMDGCRFYDNDGESLPTLASLVATCSTMHREAIYILYRDVDFTFNSVDSSDPWESMTIAQERRLNWIRHVTFEISPFCRFGLLFQHIMDVFDWGRCLKSISLEIGHFWSNLDPGNVDIDLIEMGARSEIRDMVFYWNSIRCQTSVEIEPGEWNADKGLRGKYDDDLVFFRDSYAATDAEEKRMVLMQAEETGKKA
ncbi:Hypothetical protein D9617_27g045350 [Elsinoe fawcettii]|nr:Hypothetical protein D9617_27g045350 [Elsinoe fawcettii]